MLFLHNTSRCEDEPYPTLLRDKGFGGFPSLAYMSADGEVLMKPQARTVEAFESGLDALAACLELRKKVAKAKGEGRDALEAELLVTELSLDMLEFDVASKRFHAAKGQLTDEQLASAQSALYYLEFKQVERGARDLGHDGVLTALGMMRNGERVPSGTRAVGFWRTYANAAFGAKKADEVKLAIEELRKVAQPSDARMIEYYEKRLETLETEK